MGSFQIVALSVQLAIHLVSGEKYVKGFQKLRIHCDVMIDHLSPFPSLFISFHSSHYFPFNFLFIHIIHSSSHHLKYSCTGKVQTKKKWETPSKIYNSRQDKRRPTHVMILWQLEEERTKSKQYLNLICHRCPLPHYAFLYAIVE